MRLLLHPPPSSCSFLSPESQLLCYRCTRVLCLFILFFSRSSINCLLMLHGLLFATTTINRCKSHSNLCKCYFKLCPDLLNQIMRAAHTCTTTKYTHHYMQICIDNDGEKTKCDYNNDYVFFVDEKCEDFPTISRTHAEIWIRSLFLYQCNFSRVSANENGALAITFRFSLPTPGFRFCIALSAHHQKAFHFFPIFLLP